MDIKQLEVFVAVSKYKSFSKAARELFLTQPTVSSHIQNLENELQTVLLNRSNKTITLTDSGQLLYKHAIVIINSCKKAVYDIKEYSGKIEGSIHIVCSSIPETYIFPVFLSQFCKEYPNITFYISHCDSNLVVPEILSERATFGIVGSRTKHPHVEYHKILEDDLCLICPNDLEIPNKDGVVDINTFKNLTLIMRKDGSGTRNALSKSLSEAGISINSLNVRAVVESNEAIIEMVMKGLGSSLVSKMSVEDRIARGELKNYKIQGLGLNRDFYFLFSKKKIFTPTEKKFLEYFSDQYNLGIISE